MKTTVVYHSGDFDGIFCREIAKKFLGTEGVEYIGWNFGEKPLVVPDGRLYVMDLPLDAPFGFDYRKVGNQRGPQHPPGLIWIDHHKSSIESHPADIHGYRIDGVAACRLAWQWFANEKNRDEILGNQSKQDFIDRKVDEPYSVRLAGEYDIWDKRDPNAETFQFALRSLDLSEYHWENLLSLGLQEFPDGSTMTHSEQMSKALLINGALLQCYQQKNDASIMDRSFMLEFEGLKFLALNTARCNSLTFAAKDNPETGHDALMGFYFNGRKWIVSMYHAKHRTDIDLSNLAVKHGGGGHRGACGFECSVLPMLDFETEKHIMQLAAISTASIQNTDSTVRDRIDKSNPYFTTAYADVCRAVDREMEWRNKVENKA